jgi:cation:H+ antiporter
MLLDLTALSLWTVVAIMAGAALAICLAGTRLADLADTLADRTGMGEIVAGALFVGASTSLPGVITSITTAAQDYPGLAIGNALGGLTAQTTFLAVADLAYRKANLEHAAASVTGLTQGTPGVAADHPAARHGHARDHALGVHPASVLLFVCYGFGLRLLAQVEDEPMWSPVRTGHTQDEAEQAEATGTDERATGTLWRVFLVYAVITAGAGYVVGEAASALVELTALSQSAVGTVFAAVANSLPELVTAIAAVRIGAVNLAVGDVIGGNSFEVLFLAAADFFYRPGSIYHEFDTDNLFIAVLAILMTGVLLLGMLRRQRHGIAGIGFESALVLLLYVGSVVLLFV